VVGRRGRGEGGGTVAFFGGGGAPAVFSSLGEVLQHHVRGRPCVAARLEGTSSKGASHHGRGKDAAVVAIWSLLAMAGGLRCSGAAKQSRGEEQEVVVLSNVDGRVRRGRSHTGAPDGFFRRRTGLYAAGVWWRGGAR
jgi:hypothetical protein